MLKARAEAYSCGRRLIARFVHGWTIEPHHHVGGVRLRHSKEATYGHFSSTAAGPSSPWIHARRTAGCYWNHRTADQHSAARPQQGARAGQWGEVRLEYAVGRPGADDLHGGEQGLAARPAHQRRDVDLRRRFDRSDRIVV